MRQINYLKKSLQAISIFKMNSSYLIIEWNEVFADKSTFEYD
jgi:hypothetical protein